MKTCTKCKTLKEKLEFHKCNNCLDGRQGSCKQCVSELSKQRYKNPQIRETILARSKERNRNSITRLADAKRQRQWQIENRESIKNRNLKAQYGITLEEWNRRSEEQKGRCAICKQVPKGKGFYVDHDHATGAVRGLLCFTCNMGLGLLKDSVANARAVVSYLEKNCSLPLTKAPAPAY